MKNVLINRYSPMSSGTSITNQVADCYRTVFAESPWHEWMQCSVCKQYWGLQDKAFLESKKFQHCGTALSEFWPHESVVEDLYNEITPQSSAWIATVDDSVVGFCFGYSTDLSTLEKKLNITLSEAITKNFGKQINVAYQDELGVLSAYRKQKIAKTMFIFRLEDFITQGLEVGIVRTRRTPEPSDTYLWYTAIGYKIIAEYPNEDGRVILGMNLSDLITVL